MSAAREINITPSFKNELHALPPAHFKQVWDKVDFLVENPIPDGKQKKKLEAKKDLYRLRVGDFRVFYTFGPTWVRLLGVRRKNERTYGDRIDTLAANEPEFTSIEEDLSLIHI